MRNECTIARPLMLLFARIFMICTIRTIHYSDGWMTARLLSSFSACCFLSSFSPVVFYCSTFTPLLVLRLELPHYSSEFDSTCCLLSGLIPVQSSARRINTFLFVLSEIPMPSIAQVVESSPWCSAVGRQLREIKIGFLRCGVG